MADPLRARGYTKQYSLYLSAGWTLLVVFSLLLSVSRSRESNLEKARIEARILYEMNLAYHAWGASQGGFYVPVTGHVRPNPFLAVSERDVVTASGKKLTLVNPPWMSRQVFETLREQSSLPIVNNLTSLNYLNPQNKPDSWEEKALHAFVQGSPEVSSVQNINGGPYMRLIRPFVAQQQCLKCHSHEAVGSIRGGMSIAIPLGPHLETQRTEIGMLAATHSFFWLVGMTGIVAFTRRMRLDHSRIIESEEKYRLLFENNPNPMWVYDLHTLAFLTVNEAAVVRYGYSKNEFLSMTIKDIKPPEDVSALAKNVSRAKSGVDHAGVWRHRKKDGSFVFVEITSHTLNFAGRPAQLVMINDISDRKRLEDQLRHSQKMEAVGLLAGGVAHDFNNILTAIIGYSSLTRMKLNADDPLLHNIEEVLASAERGAVLTQSLLAFSRKQVMNPRSVDINKIIERVAKLLHRLIGEDIKLEIETAAEELTVVADSGQIEQVLMNLATNARDSMPAGGYLVIGTARMALDDQFMMAHHYGKAGEFAVITISDTGMGMDDITASRIFEPFFTTKEMGRGTGLGLSIVYGIVKQHNGYINVYTEPGKGTTFRIYLPIAQSRPEEAVPCAAPLAPPIKQGNETVLVAEDDAQLRQLVRSLLSEFGYRVIEAVDGDDALAKIRNYGGKIDLLLLDVIMPKKNGMDVYREASKLIPGVPALFTSGYSADILEKKGVFDQGMHFVSKPVSPTELLTRVREIIEKDGLK